jgi:hypothetical protein
VKEETASKIVSLLTDLLGIERERLAVARENQNLAKRRDKRRVAMDEKLSASIDVQIKAQEAFVKTQDPSCILPGLTELSRRGKGDA